VADAAGGEAKRRRALVIDDSVGTANGLREVFQLAGFEAEVAYDGEQGLKQAAAFDPDIVVCDLRMPGVDGYQLAQRVRRDPGLARTILIAMSGYDSREDVARAVASGFDAHLAKPVILDDLFHVLDRFEAARRGA